MAISYFISLFYLLTCLGTTFAERPPPVFIFGDSTSDVGTNSYIPECSFKSNYPPYGVDFNDSKATGRWSNGFNTVDYICKFMGHERSPEPFLSYHNKTIIPDLLYRGVSFASAGSGLLYTTGQNEHIVAVPQQIKQFISVKNIIDNMGGKPSDAFFHRSIFIISVGSNDITCSYFNDYIRSHTVFIDALMAYYKSAIERLYDLGARKFGLISALPMGCLPLFRAQNPTGHCLYQENMLSLKFYRALNALAKEISSNHRFKGFKYSLGNTYHMIMHYIEQNTPSDGLVVDTACCGSGIFNSAACNASANLCDNREKYGFWDLAHPTDHASELAARAMYDGDLEKVSPINFRQLVEATKFISSQ